MSQPADPFEARLEAMFADPVEAPDAEAFAQAAQRRILGEQKRRGLVFGACAAVSAVVAGGVVAVTGWRDASSSMASFEAVFDRIQPSWVQEAAPVVLTAMLLLFLVEQFMASQSRY